MDISQPRGVGWESNVKKATNGSTDIVRSFVSERMASLKLKVTIWLLQRFCCWSLEKCIFMGKCNLDLVNGTSNPSTYPPVWDQWALSLNRIGCAFRLFHETTSLAWSTTPPEYFMLFKMSDHIILVTMQCYWSYGGACVGWQYWL